MSNLMKIDGRFIPDIILSYNAIRSVFGVGAHQLVGSDP